MNKKLEKTLRKLKYYSISTVILLVVAEIILSLCNIFPSDYYTNTPNSEFTWKIDHNEITGIQQDSEVSFDELGARSISNYENKDHKIIVFGGSTTACFALTQEKTWSALLEEKLGDSYWVGNFGRPGNSSNHHVLQFEHILKKEELKDAKTVLIMQGVNDLVGYLISSERYLNLPKQKLKRIAFQHVPDENIPFYKKLTLYKLARRAKKNISFYFKHKDYLTQAVTDVKLLRTQVERVHTLPELTEGLEQYEKNTQNIIDQAKEKNIRVIFITQATMWKPNLEAQYEKLMLTSGFANNEAFYSTEALYHGMEAFNQRLKTVCDRNSVSYINLELPKTTASFYDDFHFNESGANLASDEISKALKVLLKK
ncbi:SGNH/GDSL hydrolase family protein [Kordia sp. YSTF-M3]|uniref:SGNH/GDSL hydrolase family protein n=1 Tax=Kordia aestuariivivens TaxID=2759037 RepID=A0ABR7Q398_9FLAO|nr:SGNH/GDSL hydrolase family protein [Kordia aestuariivivens]MBC8753032.1 SGNH/GDSL hydrolase family protein [Kordia aestuariivivens]